MKVRSLIVAGVLAAAGLFGTAGKADAQFVIGIGAGNPYLGYGGGYPGFSNYGYRGFATPAFGGYPSYGYANSFGNSYLGYGNPYYGYRSSAYSNPFAYGYSNYRYVSPSFYGPGGYQYNYGNFRRW